MVVPQPRRDQNLRPARHIPGADNIFGMRLLDESGHFHPQEELAALLPGEQGERDVIYCGGSILASLNAFVMTRLGCRCGRLYRLTPGMGHRPAMGHLPIEK